MEEMERDGIGLITDIDKANAKEPAKVVKKAPVAPRVSPFAPAKVEENKK